MIVKTQTEVYRDPDDTNSGTEMVTVEIAGIVINIYEYGVDQVVIDVDSHTETAGDIVRVRIDDGEVYR